MTEWELEKEWKEFTSKCEAILREGNNRWGNTWRLCTVESLRAAAELKLLRIKERPEREDSYLDLACYAFLLFLRNIKEVK